MNNILERDIKTLGLNKNLIDKLIENNILNVYKLCSYSRMELSKLKFTILLIMERDKRNE